MLSIRAKGLGKESEKVYELRQFDDYTEFLNESRARARADESSSRVGRHGFYVSQTYEEAYEQAMRGWDTVRPKVDKTLNALRERIQDMVTPAPVRIHDMIGYEPDIDRYVSGEIECMFDEMVIEMPHAGKVFTLLLDLSLTCDQDRDEMLKRGAAIVALVEAFQMFGFELEIWSEITLADSRTYTEYHTTLVRIARAGEYLDINAVMFPLANPDWHRRITFGFQEGETDEIRNKWGYGVGMYGSSRRGSHMGERVGASLEISIERPDGRMVSDPVEWIVSQLVTQGVMDDADD